MEPGQVKCCLARTGEDLMMEFLNLSMSDRVVKTALRIALIVGTVLAVINHGPAIFAMTLSQTQMLQIGLTYLVPYGVSTYSSVVTLKARTN